MNTNNLQLRGLRTYHKSSFPIASEIPIQNLVILRTIKTRLVRVTTVFDAGKNTYYSF